jgi:hypothetical protein
VITIKSHIVTERTKMTTKKHFIGAITAWLETEPDEASLMYYETVIFQKLAHVNKRQKEVKRGNRK